MLLRRLGRRRLGRRRHHRLAALFFFFSGSVWYCIFFFILRIRTHHKATRAGLPRIPPRVFYQFPPHRIVTYDHYKVRRGLRAHTVRSAVDRRGRLVGHPSR